MDDKGCKEHQGERLLEIYLLILRYGHDMGTEGRSTWRRDDLHERKP